MEGENQQKSYFALTFLAHFCPIPNFTVEKWSLQGLFRPLEVGGVLSPFHFWCCLCFSERSLFSNATLRLV